jgi:hypothetical protein
MVQNDVTLVFGSAYSSASASSLSLGTPESSTGLLQRVLETNLANSSKVIGVGVVRVALGLAVGAGVAVALAPSPADVGAQAVADVGHAP